MYVYLNIVSTHIQLRSTEQLYQLTIYFISIYYVNALKYFPVKNFPYKKFIKCLGEFHVDLIKILKVV